MYTTYTTLFIIACAAMAFAQPNVYFYALPPHAADSVLQLSSQRNGMNAQYHAQDVFGQYSYGYAGPLAVKQETRTLDGATRGKYSYIDAAGIVQTVQYIADAGGFRVKATNLPQANVPLALKPNEETAEVAALRAQHLQAHKQAQLRLAGDTTTIINNLPQPVQDTPEVAAAKVEFFKRYEAEKLRHKLLSQRQNDQSLAQPNAIAATITTTTASKQAPIGYLYKLPLATLPRFYLPLP